jgi:hypothetical protein
MVLVVGAARLALPFGDGGEGSKKETGISGDILSQTGSRIAQRQLRPKKPEKSEKMNHSGHGRKSLEDRSPGE